MSTLADERHSLLTEAAVAAPPPPQQNHVPQQAPPRPQRQLPEPTPPAKPTVFKPTGPPIPALSGIGYWGSINDFNHAVQAAHDGYVAANGVRPDPRTLLNIALKTPVTAGRPDQGPPFKTTLPPIGQQGHNDLLKQMKDITRGPYDNNVERHKDFNDFIQQHSDILQGMLNDPKTHSSTLAAINDTQSALDFHGQNPGKNPLSFGGFVKDLTVKPTTWFGRTAFAFAKDVDSLGIKTLAVDQTGSRKSVHDLKQAATFPALTKAAPAVAQVVKGLVYSPAGIAQAAISLELDINDAANWTQSGGKHGNPDFKRTQKLGIEFGKSLWADLNDPGGRAGYLLLDAFGLISLGAGTAVRFGRAADAFGEASRLADTRVAKIDPEMQARAASGDQYARDFLLSKGLDWRKGLDEFSSGKRDISAGFKAGAKAFVKPHDLKTVEYNKGGYTENISILGNPFSAWVQQKIPHFGTDAQISHLLDPMHDPMSWMREMKVGEDAYQRGSVTQAMANVLDSVNPFSPEARMGRAGSIRRATETKALSANAQLIEDAAGYAARSTFLDNVLPEGWFDGLTRGELKAIQAASWDVPGDIHAKISAEERTHQFLIESKMGSREAHMEQIANLALARDAVKSPSARLQTVLGAIKEATSKVEQMRLAYGMPEQVAEARVLEPGVFMDLAGQAQETMRQIRESLESQPPPIPLNYEAIPNAPDIKRVTGGLYEAASGRVEIHRLEGVRPPTWNADWKTDYLHGAGHPATEMQNLIVDGAASLADAKAIVEQKWKDISGLAAKHDATYNPEVPGQRELELRLHNLKSAMGKLDVRYIPEDYIAPQYEPSARLSKSMEERDKLKASLDKIEAAEHEWVKKNQEKIDAAVKGKGREFALGNKFREQLLNVSERLKTAEEKVKRADAKERASHAKAHPPEGLPEGYYTKVGSDWVPVNRNDPDSFYLPILLRGHATPITKGNVRLPGSIFGIGKNTTSVWEDHQMTGRALIDGDFRIDAHNLAGQSFASTARAIVRMNAWDKAWNAGRELGEGETIGPHEIYIRDIVNIPYDIRKSLAAFYEGKITQDQIDSIPADLMKHLTPTEPKPGEHVRAIDQRILGDLFFGDSSRAIAAGEPLVRGLMSPINNTLRPLILYNPKYALNILGNASMLIFDQGFIRSGENLAAAFSMKDWALEDDFGVFKKLMGAGKASAYMSGESVGRLASVSQGLADFWSRASDQEFRIASGIYYAKRVINEAPDKFEGETFPEKFHDLLTNENHQVSRNDVIKRGNDALVAFDRMAPIEKAILRHFIFVYPWQRGALLWSFRAIFEHPAKSALLATLGQEAYTEDKWLTTVPEWVRTTGYIPFHWVGDKVSVLNPTSVTTFSTLGEILGTIKGLVEGDAYARFSDLFGPAGQFVSHAASGVDSFGNPYKGSQLLGAVEDTLNMLPAISSYRRSAKGTGKALRAYDVSSRTGLSSVLTSAAKATALSPGWLDGWANVFIGGFNPRELNLTAAAARYWVTAPPEERHQHQVDLIMRQLALQASFLKTGKVPDDKTVSDMLMAPIHSVQIKGAIPEDVRQSVLDAGQISYQAQIQSTKLGRSLTEKEQLLLSLKYYREAGRLPKADYNGYVEKAKGLNDLPDIKALKGQVALKYGHAHALYEWDRRVRIQNSFVDKQVGPANLAQRINVLYSNGLARQQTVNLNDDERSQYGHLYTEYVTARDAYKATLTADKSLTGTQRAIRMAAFDSKHNEPVKIGGRILPSMLALGTGANWDIASTDAATEMAQRRLFLSATKNWYHLNSAEKEMFGRKTTPEMAHGWQVYWDTLAKFREAGNTVNAGVRKDAATYVNSYYARGFISDWNYAIKTPKIERLVASKMYKSIPEQDAFGQITTLAKQAAALMADGQHTISGVRHDWKAYVNNSLLPWLEKDHPQLYAWLQPLGPSFLTSLINTG